MKTLIKRIIGIGLVAIAVLSLLVTLFSLYPLWRVRRPLTERLVAGADLLLATLDTTGQALDVAESGLKTVHENVLLLENTTLSVAQTVSNTRPIVDAATQLIGRNLAGSIQATSTTIRSAQSSARFVDDFLAALARLPLGNATYQPAVTLSDSLGHVADSLDDLPGPLGSIEDSLSATGDNLGTVTDYFVALAGTMGQIRLSVSEAQGVVDRYQDRVISLQALLRSLRVATPGAVTAGTIVLTFVILWLAAVQAGAAMKGWDWIRGR